MIRKIIKIDQNKCNGCGACAKACHEGAIEMINGKAQLTRENFCDGLGDCLPACPVDAIRFEEREAPEYDEKAVMASKNRENLHDSKFCPGTLSRKLKCENKLPIKSNFSNSESQLLQWPVQIKLSPISTPYFNNANLLIAADCTAYAYANFHNDFMKNHITLIGCPKLDSINYADKLSAIITNNNVKSITVVRMEVPCCGGIENAVKNALKFSEKSIPLKIITISTKGKIIE